MRNLKFRAWDKYENKMIYKFMLGSDTNEQSDLWTCPITWNGQDWVNNDCLILMEKVDTPILDLYEGDFICKDNRWDLKIEYLDGCLRVVDVEKVRYINKCSNIPVHEFDFEGWKVVGNIYEGINEGGNNYE